MKTCLQHEGPASVRYPRGVSLGVKMDAEPKALPVGQGEVLKEGTDVALIAIGVTVWEAFKAAERLEQEGISTAVVNGRFVKPLDVNLIGDVAKKVRYVVTVEEGARMGGFGSAVLEALSELGSPHLRTKVLGLPDWYIEQGPQDLLRERYGLTADGIYESVKALLAQEVTSESATTRQNFAVAGFTKRESLGDEQGS
jgi:1-deoxy-D-xylulose-5-phosphate synthase